MQGYKYLGGHLGNQVRSSRYAMDLAENWCTQLRALSAIAKSQPQAAYACFMSRFRHKVAYFMRTFPELHHHLDSLDALIDSQFILTTAKLLGNLLRLCKCMFRIWEIVAFITIENGRYVHSSLLLHYTVRIRKFEEGYPTTRCKRYPAVISWC